MVKNLSSWLLFRSTLPVGEVMFNTLVEVDDVRTAFPWNLRHPLQRAQVPDRVLGDETTRERLSQICAIIVCPAYLVLLCQRFEVALVVCDIRYQFVCPID